jgi:4'-phosphopantetheinyl transferase
MALAFARDHDPGIDIELERGLPRAVDLARRFLSAEEAEWIAGLEPAGQASAFLRQWTAREALVKAQGCGLAGALAELAIDASAPIIRRLPPGWPSPERWRLIRLPLPEGLVGHLALAARLDGVDSVRLDPAVAVE